MNDRLLVSPLRGGGDEVPTVVQTVEVGSQPAPRSTPRKPDDARPLYVVPMTQQEANDLVARWHRHHEPTLGRFAIGVVDENGVPHGAAICGRPVARLLDQRFVCEVNRCATDGTPNVPSMLYAAAARAARAMGYERIQTYILDVEPGTTLRAAGWEYDGVYGGGSWTNNVRTRKNAHPLTKKGRWSLRLNEDRPDVVTVGESEDLTLFPWDVVGVHGSQSGETGL